MSVRHGMGETLARMHRAKPPCVTFHLHFAKVLWHAGFAGRRKMKADVYCRTGRLGETDEQVVAIATP